MRSRVNLCGHALDPRKRIDPRGKVQREVLEALLRHESSDQGLWPLQVWEVSSIVEQRAARTLEERDAVAERVHRGGAGSVRQLTTPLRALEQKGLVARRRSGMRQVVELTDEGCAAAIRVVRRRLGPAACAVLDLLGLEGEFSEVAVTAALGWSPAEQWRMVPGGVFRFEQRRVFGNRARCTLHGLALEGCAAKDCRTDFGTFWSLRPLGKVLVPRGK